MLLLLFLLLLLLLLFCCCCRISHFFCVDPTVRSLHSVQMRHTGSGRVEQTTRAGLGQSDHPYDLFNIHPPSSTAFQHLAQLLVAVGVARRCSRLGTRITFNVGFREIIWQRHLSMATQCLLVTSLVQC
jgi:hypothetical protein